MWSCGIQTHSPESHSYYIKGDSVDDVISTPNADELVKNGNFFKDKTAINFALNEAKENEIFNAIIIENAYHSINGNYCYINNPIVNQLDMANIIARKASKLLQEEIDKGNPYYVTAGSILDQLIVAEVSGVNTIDINNSDWVANNPLTKAMKLCIGDNHDQADINAVISDRVIQYYQYKMGEQDSLDLDNHVKRLTGTMLFTISGSQKNNSMVTDQDNFIRDLIELGNKPASNKRDAVYISSYA
ncbi:hypothetical protein [Yersinia rohdei]|uniref:hypothetical protein n=1 Tax=Yersinia rohdei TaxID=29485 RepID=UPI0011AB20F9|nr:hypothetical protein [Yersinia rohdei]